MGIDDANNGRHKCSRVTTALLLAAGMGKRLQPLTCDAPKCLTEINGIPILERQIRCLRHWGFERLLVVTGYLEHRIREFLEERSGGLVIDYIVSPQYRTTNNIYSLWLARELIREPFLLLESDLVFDQFLLRDMLVPNKIAVARMELWLNGSTVSVDPFGRIVDFRVGQRAVPGVSSYKTVNTYSLSSSSWQRVVERLDRRVSAGRVNDYYEAVFAEMVADGSLSFQPVFFDDGPWCEVDTLEDVHEAERLFSRGSGLMTSLPVCEV